MKKRVISFLLCIAMLIGMLPVTASAAVVMDVEEVDECVVHIKWEQDGEILFWESGYPEEEPFPEGVTLEQTEDSCVVTLRDADLVSLWIDDWGWIPVTIVVEGENTITSTGDDMALYVNCCHDVTICGGGVLNLQSQVTALSWHDFYDETGDLGYFLECPNGQMTIRDVTIHANNDWEHWDGEGERSQWSTCGACFVGGQLLVTDNAKLYAVGPAHSGAEGSVTVNNGGEIHATGWSHNGRSYVNSDDPEDWKQTLTIGEGGKMVLSMFEECFEQHVMWIGSNCNVLIDGGTLEIDGDGLVNDGSVISFGGSGEEEIPSTFTINSGEMILNRVAAEGVKWTTGVWMDSGCAWTQNGGTVRIDLDRRQADWAEAVYMSQGSTYSQHGGTLRIRDLSAEEAVVGQSVNGLTMATRTSHVISGGCLEIEGNFSCGWGLGSFGDLTISGGELDIGGDSAFMVWHGRTNILNGSIETSNMEVTENGSLRMMGGTLDVAETLAVRRGYARFSGGTTTIKGEPALLVSAEDKITYDDGIAALDAEGRAVTFAEYGYEWASDARGVVTIKNQRAAGDSCNALMELMNTSTVVAGNAAQIRLAVSLDKAEETVDVKLPRGISLQEGSVTVNSKAAAYTETADGFTVKMGSGDVLRYGIIPTVTGEVTLTAQAGSATANLTMDVRACILAMPSSINEPRLHVSGTAAPGARLTFVDGNTEVGEAVANALGSWAADLELDPTVNTHAIYARVEVDGSAVDTDVYTVFYKPEGAVVETLKITNWIHGQRDFDPPQEVAVTVNYLTGERSQNYYTYWPDMPDFTFEVTFADGLGTPERVYDVNVVATDYYGTEGRVALSYQKATGTWVGAGEFCGYDDIVPEMFRVEWKEYEIEKEPEIPLDEIEPLIPEKVEEDYSDSAMVMAESLRYEFDLSEDADGLTVADGAGQTVTVRDNAFTGESGTLYYASLEAGTFESFGTDTLCILMPATGESSWTYQDNVHFEEDGDKLQAGDVLISGDSAYKVVSVEKNGSYKFEEASIEDVFYDLSIDGLGLPEDGAAVVVDNGVEEALISDFLETSTYLAYREALDRYTAQTAEDEEETDEKLKATFDYSTEVEGNQVKLTMKPSITLNTEMEAELPEPQGTMKTEVEATFAYTYVMVMDLRAYVEHGKFQGAAFLVDETNSFTVDAKVVVNGEEDESVDLGQFFGEALSSDEPGKVVEEYLEKLEVPDDENQSVTLIKVRLKTNVPFVDIALSAELELEEGFNGELEAGAEVTFGQIYGFYVESDGDVRTSYEQKEFYAKAEGRFHMEADMAVYLKISCGPQLLNILNASIYGKIGPKLKVGGHGSACISTKKEENSAEAEFWFGETLELAMGYSVSVRALAKKWEVSDDLFSYSHPIGFIGTDIMPARFAQVEKEVYVHDALNLYDLVDLNLIYQRFSNGLQTGTKVFEPENYKFTLEVGNNFTIVEGDEGAALIYVRNGKQESEGWLRVEYTCPSGNYTLTKVIKIKYVPSSIIINKRSKKCNNRVAGFTILRAEEVELSDGTTEIIRRGVYAHATTNSAGRAVVPVESGYYYIVIETAPPAGHMCAPEEAIVYVQGTGASVGFLNYRPEEPEPTVTPDIEVPSNGDPSGYVFEGITSNRLEGVTVKLYRSDESDGRDEAFWNASEFDQENPLTTNALGEYLWMVPSGWYQVRYEKAGYESAASEWMEVPPIRTDVNQGLVSYAPAEMTMEWSEVYYRLMLTFTRPVQVSSLSDVVLTVNGEECSAGVVALDSGWSVTEDPADSTVCATAFLLEPHTDKLPGAKVKAQVAAVTYAGTESSCTSAAVQLPENIDPPVYYELYVEGGSGSGEYEAGEQVTVRAEEIGCKRFDYWIADGVELANPEASRIVFAMPENHVALWAVYTQLDHSCENGTVAVEPGCTEPGVMDCVCDHCGYEYTREIPAVGHSYEQGACIRCGDVCIEAPTVKAANVISTGKIKISWNKVEGAAKYELYRATSENGAYTLLKTTTGTSLTNTTVKVGETWYYKVVAITGDGARSADSNIASCTCDLAQPVVTLGNVQSSGKIKIMWDKINGAVKYKIYYATAPNGTYKALKTTTGTSLTHTSTVAGQTYYYKVIALAENSAANSAFSAVKYLTCDLAQPVVTLGNVQSSGKIKISWNRVEGAVKYKVYCAASKTGTYKALKTTTGTSLTHTSTVAGRTYYYKVIALAETSAANSAFSAVKYLTCDLARPDVKVSLNSKGKPVVTWGAVSGAVKYTVYIYDANGALLKTASTTATKATHSTAVKGKTYSYQVVAVASLSAANSAKSVKVSIKSR